MEHMSAVIIIEAVQCTLRLTGTQDSLARSMPVSLKVSLLQRHLTGSMDIIFRFESSHKMLSEKANQWDFPCRFTPGSVLMQLPDPLVSLQHSGLRIKRGGVKHWSC